jgi:hypothetical protein
LGEIHGELILDKEAETPKEDLIYVFVNASEERSEFYIIPSSVVAQSLVARKEWRDLNGRKQPEAKMRMFFAWESQV